MYSERGNRKACASGLPNTSTTALENDDSRNRACVIEIRPVRVEPIFRKCLTNAGASLSEKILQGQRVGDGSRFLRNRSLLTAALLLVFGAALRHMPVYACSCIRGGGTFVMNRESDDKTLILPRDARGVLWWQEAYAQKGSFGVRLLSGVRERDLDFRVIEVKPDLLLIAPTDKLVPGNRYLFTYRGDSKQPRNVQEVEAVVENTAFAAIKDQFQLWVSQPGPAQIEVPSGGMCSRTAEVVGHDVHISEPAAIERWRFALLFETVLDGKREWRPKAHVCGDPPPGSSWRGHGRDLIFAECAKATSKEIAGTTEGEHDVYMTISVPGTNLVASTKKQPLKLMCGSSSVR